MSKKGQFKTEAVVTDDLKEPVSLAPEAINNQTSSTLHPTDPITDSAKAITESASIADQTREQDGEPRQPIPSQTEFSVYRTESMDNLKEPIADPLEPLINPLVPVSNLTDPLSRPLESVAVPTDPIANSMALNADQVEPLADPSEPIADQQDPIPDPPDPMRCPENPTVYMAQTIIDLLNPANDQEEPIDLTNPEAILTKGRSDTTKEPIAEQEYLTAKSNNWETPVLLQDLPVGKCITHVAQRAAPITKRAAPITKRAAPIATRAAPIAEKAAPIAKRAAPIINRTTVTRVVSTKDFLSDDLPGTCTSVRWRVALCSFFALFFSQTFRVNFTVGMSCMVSSSPADLVRGIQRNLTTSLGPGGGFGGLGDLAPVNMTRGNNSSTDQDDDFDWSRKTQTTLLSAYFYGYIVSQVPGGWLSRRYGTRWVVGIAMIVAMGCTALTPLCARTDVYLLFGIRVILGAAQGMGYPAVFNLTGRWIPPLETSRFLVVTSAGYPIGHILAFTVSALLCRFGFDDGWGSIFYVFDCASVFWIVAWFYMVYDTPLQHPRISQAEQEYIIARVGPFLSKEEKRQSTPWCRILLSPPVWGCALAYFATDWLKYTIQLGIVIYMRRVLRYKITQSGVVAALPFIVFFFSSIVVGFLADLILEKNKMTRANTRRLFQVVSFVPMGVLVGAIGFITRDLAGLAVAFFIMSQMLFGLSQAGYLVSIVDFAPRFAGEISGMMNVVATLPGLLVPLAMTALTSHGTQTEWRNVFLIAGGIAVLGTIGFCAFARGEIQPWAEFRQTVAPEEELMIDGKPSDENEKK